MKKLFLITALASLVDAHVAVAGDYCELDSGRCGGYSGGGGGMSDGAAAAMVFGTILGIMAESAASSDYDEPSYQAPAARQSAPAPAPKRQIAKTNKSSPRAPYIKRSCVRVIKQGKSNFDYDHVWVRNDCGRPVEIQFCTVPSDRQKYNPNCDAGSAVRWGLSNKMAPGGKDLFIADGKPPYRFRLFICDLTPINGQKPLCLLPK
ncbi:MAG: hypothetical protein QM682_11600 [Paracoccus sp. (in: a-proteobacteria)]|uniref:hypothetical protein n=1 Tax=Paracoccus sp. TaxID=267 RepID=UPI0039E5931A